MLIQVNAKEFKNRFIKQANPFLSLDFLALNKQKVDSLVYLIENKKRKIDIGLVAGIKNGTLLSPFSAPFGGFYFRHDNIFVKDIDRFLMDLKQYIFDKQLKEFRITLPPDIYHPSFNAKTINALIRTGFEMEIPEITNYIDLINFSGLFSDANSRNNLRKAIKYNLSFHMLSSRSDKEKAFELIKVNRQSMKRPIFMTFDDLEATEKLWPIDFFEVRGSERNLLASAIFYKAHSKIIYGAFWGDNELGRSLRAMDFLSFNLWNHYKDLGYKAIDFGISTESGVPNEGLLRFKEAHDSISSLRFSFKWKPNSEY